MSLKIIPLCDRLHHSQLDVLELGPDEIGLENFQVRVRRLVGGHSHGVQVVEMFNGEVQVAVLPTRGMGLWKMRATNTFTSFFSDEPAVPAVELGWHSPVNGPVHPSFVNLWEPSGIGWLSGFDEFLVRCGLQWHGAPEFDNSGRLTHPLHGTIANTPADDLMLEIDSEQQAVRLTGKVCDGRLFHPRLELTSDVQLSSGDKAVVLRDQVKNIGALGAELELLYHINVGRPLLNPGSKVVLPVSTMAPKDARAAEGYEDWETYREPQKGFAEQVYFFQLLGDSHGRTRAVLHNAHAQQGMSLIFNLTELPYFTLWKCTQSDEEGYVTGLEPCLNLPNGHDFEVKKGRVPTLEPGHSATFQLAIEPHSTPAEVAEAVEIVGRLQQLDVPDFEEKPLPEWSPS